jgi:hypothetical protein
MGGSNAYSPAIAVTSMIDGAVNAGALFDEKQHADILTGGASMEIEFK